ncbi:hypothetical protein SRRS_48120 [Sporomusa rhizae]|uniref:PAS domain S-box protein n=1 Tax=Sporomusa rhizae TaxID=357999 RepID=UPI00352B9A8B
MEKLFDCSPGQGRGASGKGNSSCFNRDEIVVSSLRDAFIIIDNTGKIVFWNEAATRILIYTAEEALGTELCELIAPKHHKDQYKQVFRVFQSTGEVGEINHKIELQAIRKDQVEIAVELSVFSVKTVDKECTVCILRDLSGREWDEQVLRRANEQLEAGTAELTETMYALNRKLVAVQEEVVAVKQKLIQTMREKEQEIEVRRQAEHARMRKTEEMERFFLLNRDLLCFVDMQGSFIRVNKAFALTLGYSTEEITGQPFLYFVHPDDITSTKDAFTGVLRGQVINGFCNRYRCKQGNYRWFEWTTLIDEITGIVYGTARDITARKKAEEVLQRKNKKVVVARRKAEEGWHHLNNVLQNVDAVIWQLNKNGVFTLYEGQMLKKMARKPGHSVGISIFKLCKEYPDIIKTVKRSLQGKSSKIETQYKNMIISMICTPLIDLDGNINGVVGITIDITKHCDLERRVKFIQENYRRSADFNDILTGRGSVEEQNRRLGNYGIDVIKPVTCYLLTVSPKSMAIEDVPFSKEDIMEWLVEEGYIWNWYTHHGIGMLMQPRIGVSRDEYDERCGANALKENLEKHFPEIMVKIGVATTGSGTLNLSQLYYKAYAALLLTLDKEGSAVCCYSDSGIYQVLPFVMENMDIDDFVNRILGGIIEYEKNKGGDLFATLGAILTYPNLKTVAIELQVHHNTVLWRKNKIETILGYTLDDANQRINLAVAIKLQKIRKFMQGKF